MKNLGLFSIPFLLMIFSSLFTLNAQKRARNYLFSELSPEPVLQVKRSAPTFQSVQTLSGYYFQGFEETNFPPAGWQVIDKGDAVTTWTPSILADLPTSFEGEQSAYGRYSLDPVVMGEDWLISPRFQVIGGDSLFFRFKQEYQGYAPDSTLILVSTTDSSTGSFTHHLALYAEGLNYPNDTINWYPKNVPLGLFAGQSVYLAFVHKNSFGDGVFIDNVEIGTRPAAEVGILSLSIKPFLEVGESCVPTLILKNYGSQAQTFSATIQIGSVYNQTLTTTLLSQELKTESFPVWIGASGAYPVKASVHLEGDPRPENDTLSTHIKVLEPFQNYGWSVHEPIPSATFGTPVVSITPVSNPRFFLFGGYSNSTIVKDVHQFDVGFNTWSESPSMTQEATYCVTATGNGKVFVFGGRTLTAPQGRTKIFNYTTETWSNGVPMPTPVVTAAYVTYKDSLVYIFGGLIDATGAATHLTQVYNMYTNTWSTATPKPGAAVYSSRAGLIGNKIVLAGGVLPFVVRAIDTTYVGEINPQDPSQINWTLVQSHPAGKISRCGTGVSLNPDASHVIFAAGTHEDLLATKTDWTFAFDLNTNTWKLGPKKPVAVSMFGMAPVVKNDSVFLVALGGNILIGNDLWPTNANEWLNLGPYVGTTALKPTVVEGEFDLFPNPASESVKIRFSTEQMTAKPRVSISNYDGRLVRQALETDISHGTIINLNTADLLPGLYSIQVTTSEGRTHSKRFMKQ